MNSTIVSSIAAQLQALGASFDPGVGAATRAIYLPHIDFTPVVETKDLAYGDHERHRLDMYEPEVAQAPRGVVFYVHGGGFTQGDKNGDGVFYANVGRYFARAGYLAVVINYRLAPQAPWPAGARDLQRAVRWTAERLQGQGRGNLPFFVLGQSAGASHVASWLFDAEARGDALPAVAGLMLMSGLYFVAPPAAPNLRAYFGDDKSLYAARSPLTHVARVDVPLWLSVAELDPARIAEQTFGLAHVITGAQGRSPEFAWFRSHNHVSTVQSLGTPQDDVGSELLRFINAHAR